VSCTGLFPKIKDGFERIFEKITLEIDALLRPNVFNTLLVIKKEKIVLPISIDTENTNKKISFKRLSKPGTNESRWLELESKLPFCSEERETLATKPKLKTPRMSITESPACTTVINKRCLLSAGVSNLNDFRTKEGFSKLYLLLINLPS
jgi:hypothetical protein